MSKRLDSGSGEKEGVVFSKYSFFFHIKEETIDNILLRCIKTKVLWWLPFALFGVFWILPILMRNFTWLALLPCG